MKKKNSAIVEDRAGVTKKNNWYQIEDKYWLLDTPGILQPSFDDIEQGMALATIGSIKLDILPLHDVAWELYKRLNELEEDTKYKSKEDLYNAVKESNVQENEFYKKIIKNYQQGKLTKKILDRLDDA
jgi:ribosome biogenesis GTPase A